MITSTNLLQKMKYKFTTAKSEGLLKKFLFGRFVCQPLMRLKLDFIRINDEKIKERIINNKTHQYLTHEYDWYVKTKSKEKVASEEFPKIVWWCWLQGYEKAPELSKICLNSVKEVFYNYKVNIITLENLNNYIELPEYILKKYRAGIIHAATLSDIIRLMLLNKYGGVWIDSTVLCTNNKILDLIENNDFFAFKNDVLDNNKDIKISSWFMSAKPHNILVSDTSKLMLKYWKTHNFTENYFIMHLLFTLVTEKNSLIWEKVPTFNNVSPHVMVQELNNDFSEIRFSQLNSMSSVHKLNNHQTYSDNSETLYAYLKERYLNKTKNYD